MSTLLDTLAIVVHERKFCPHRTDNSEGKWKRNAFTETTANILHTHTRDTGIVK